LRLDFICVGTQKAATTTLHDILKKHPDIFLPQEKETHFFDIEERYELGLDWMNKTFFSGYNYEKIKGEFTPEYLFYEEVPERIHSVFGEDIKIIMVLRNPVSRAFSHYLMSKRRGYEKLSFKESILTERERMVNSPFERSHFSYINRGLYYNQILRYFKYFKNKNILILNYEKDIKENLKDTINKIQDFLKLDRVDLDINIKSNTAKRARLQLINDLLNNNSISKKGFKFFFRSKKLRNKIKIFIKRINRTKNIYNLDLIEKRRIFNLYFKEDVNKIEGLLDEDLSHWYNEL